MSIGPYLNSATPSMSSLANIQSRSESAHAQLIATLLLYPTAAA
jgi:hypothetical protein